MPLQSLSPHKHVLLLNKTSTWGFTFSIVLLLYLKLSDLFWPNVLLHLSVCRKQDGSDPQVSATLEPQLFQPTLPYTGSPFHKVGGEPGVGGWVCTLTPDLIRWTSVWPFSFRSVCEVSLLILSQHLLLSLCSLCIWSLPTVSGPDFLLAELLCFFLLHS